MSTWTVVKLLLLAAYSWGWYHYGTLQTKLNDARAVVKQEAHQEAQEATDAKTINQEVQTHAQALAEPPDPTPALVCVRRVTISGVPPTAAPRFDSHAAADDPKADRSAAGDDPGPDLGRIGHAADAQITELQHYITHVCLAPR